MHPVLFEIFGRQVATYGVAFSLSLIISSLLAFRMARKDGVNEDHFLTALLLGLLGIVFVSKGMHIALNLSEYMQNPKSIYDIRSGHIFYGGYIGSILFPWIYTRIAKVRFFPILDACATYMPLGLAIHRTFGCTMAGCCYGKPTGLPWGITYPIDAPASIQYGQVPVHPAQIYEAIIALCIFAILLVWKRYGRKVAGELITLQIFLYAIGRFVIEILRGDTARGIFGSMSTSQWVSIGMLATSAFFLFAYIIPGRKARE